VTDSPFHDPQRNPLPDANDIEKGAADNNIELYSLQKVVETNGPSPHIKKDIRRLRNALLWLLVIGAALGGLLGIGAAILLKRYGFVDPPQPSQSRTLSPPDSSFPKRSGEPF